MVLPQLNEIRARRKKLNLTQHALAREAGVSQSMIAKLESGRLDPSYNSVRSIFAALEKLESKTSQRASDVMTKSVISVSPDVKVAGAIKIMKAKGISQLPVLSGRHVVGSVSEKSILDKIVEVGKAATKLKISEVLEEPFPTVSADTPITPVLSLLQHSVAVLVTRKGSMAGIITKADLLKSV